MATDPLVVWPCEAAFSSAAVATAPPALTDALAAVRQLLAAPAVTADEATRVLAGALGWRPEQAEL
jgi:hypothetical protein